jgi:hypothetical protein
MLPRYQTTGVQRLLQRLLKRRERVFGCFKRTARSTEWVTNICRVRVHPFVAGDSADLTVVLVPIVNASHRPSVLIDGLARRSWADKVTDVMRRSPEIRPEIEHHRDAHWRREGMRQVETALDAERFIEQAGFAACLTDCRKPGASLYVAVCGRRDAIMPRHVQKDEEVSRTWVLKDEIIARGQTYYAKLARGKATFLAPGMIPYFHAVWGVRQSPLRMQRNVRMTYRTS